MLKMTAFSSNIRTSIFAALVAQMPVSAFVEPVHAGVVEFSVPNSQHTIPIAINDSGAIAGRYYPDTVGEYSGFLREPDGSITTFQIPNAVGSDVYGMNKSEVIVGYTLLDETEYAFIRDAHGTITTFQAPNAIATAAQAINNEGVVVGGFSDGANVHGFVRATDGSFTAFDVNGAHNTGPTAINNKGEIAGYYQMPGGNGALHGFLRSPRGKITTFEVPNAIIMGVTGINATGDIVGWCDLNQQSFASFVRMADGTFFTISHNKRAIEAAAINKEGTVTGSDAGEMRSYGFLHKADGTFTTFEIPDKNRSTYPTAINDKGVVVGYSYRDQTSEGFLYTPSK